jgi:hypothetical protein
VSFAGPAEVYAAGGNMIPLAPIQESHHSVDPILSADMLGSINANSLNNPGSRLSFASSTTDKPTKDAYLLPESIVIALDAGTACPGSIEILREHHITGKTQKYTFTKKTVLGLLGLVLAVMLDFFVRFGIENIYQFIM